MRKGAVPVPYIVAIIFAIIVIVIIAYMFFTHSGIFSYLSTKDYCEAKKLQYCFEWAKNGKNFPPSGGFSKYDPKCTGVVDFPDDGTGANGRAECSKLNIPIP